jgi:hypothetical protein
MCPDLPEFATFIILIFRFFETETLKKTNLKITLICIQGDSVISLGKKPVIGDDEKKS